MFTALISNGRIVGLALSSVHQTSGRCASVWSKCLSWCMMQIFLHQCGGRLCLRRFWRIDFHAIQALRWNHSGTAIQQWHTSSGLLPFQPSWHGSLALNAPPFRCPCSFQSSSSPPPLLLSGARKLDQQQIGDGHQLVSLQSSIGKSLCNRYSSATSKNN